MSKPFKDGLHVVVCDTSGRECYSDEVKREWTGAIVYEKYFDKRHPQELIRIRPERGGVQPHRPAPDPVYLSTVFDYMLIETAPETEVWFILAENGAMIAQE